MTRFAAVCLLLFAAVAPAQQQTAPDLLSPAEAFRLKAVRNVPQRVRLTWTIAPGYYLYRDRFRFENALGAPLRTLVFPAGQPKNDPYFGPTEIYRDRVVIELGLDDAADAETPVSLRIISQGCADIGVCFPPQTARLTLITDQDISIGHGDVIVDGAIVSLAPVRMFARVRDAGLEPVVVAGLYDPSL